MILLFLGSWRSTVIIAVSIPLSILGSIMALFALGHTLNLMTLGGLALAIGILVDDATVTIENINWHLEQGKDVESAILDGAQQIVTPAFVSLLCICIAFVPMFFLEGVSRYLFVPMALSVIFAMVCSFILSRTLVPTMAKYLLRPHAPHTDMHGIDVALPPSRNPLVRFQRGFEARFEHIREGYRGLLAGALANRRSFIVGFLLVVTLSFGLVPFLGSNFFPSVDSGQVLMHVRLPVGTRVEETASRFAHIERTIREVIPAEEIETLIDNIGLPNSPTNLTYNNTGVMGSQDGDFQISLRGDIGRPTSMSAACARYCPNASRKQRSPSRPRTLSARSSTSAHRLLSTCKSAAATWKRTMPTHRNCSSACARFPALRMPASSSPTRHRGSTLNWIARRPDCWG